MAMNEEEALMNSLDAEVDLINQELTLFDRQIEIDDNKNFKTLKIPLRKCLILRLNIPQGYPNYAPSLIKFQTVELHNLKPQRRNKIEEFLKNAESELNELLNGLNGKLCVLKIRGRVAKNKTQRRRSRRKKSNKFKVKKTVKESEDETSKATKLKGADFIFQRIKWDSAIDKSQIIIGYLDRFLGVQEIEFNEFKGVHEDRDGIPLHRIRHFKINEKIVWDREQRIDLLTNSGDISKFFKPSEISSSSLAADILDDIDNDEINTLTDITDAQVFKFEKNRWDLIETNCDNVNKRPDFVDNMKILTYNLMSKNNFKKSLNETMKKAKNSAGVEDLDKIERMDKIIALFEQNEQDLMLLQECEGNELLSLKESNFVRRNYFISCVSKESGADMGCVILSKLKPKRVRVVRLCENSAKVSLLALFEMRTSSLSRVEKLLVANIHLTSGKANNFFAKRKSQLETLKKYLIDESIFESDYVLIGGDFNFGDEVEENSAENNLIRDLFLKNGFQDLARNLFTFDPLTNFTASITAGKLYPRRLDRFLFKTNKTNTQHQFNAIKLVNTAAFKINLENYRQISLEPYLNIGNYTSKNWISENEASDLRAVENGAHYLHASDHYGLEFSLKFQPTLHEANLTHKSTLAIVPPKFTAETIQKIRSIYDPQINRWPPHINLIYPFYLDIDSGVSLDEDGTVLSALLECLSKLEPFECELDEVKVFERNNVVYLEPNEKSRARIKKIYESLMKLFESCLKLSRLEFNPHMTIGQPVDKKKAAKTWAREKFKEIGENFSGVKLKFTVDSVCWMTRSETTPFEIKFSLPLGKRYSPVSTGLNPSDFTSNNLFKFLIDKEVILNQEAENEFSLEYKKVVTGIKESLSSINDCVESKASDQFEFVTKTDALVSLGSYLHGVKCNDFDLGLVRLKTPTDLASTIDDLVYNLAQNNSLFHIVRNIPDTNCSLIELSLKNFKLTNNADLQIHELPSEEFKLNTNLFYNNFNYMKKLMNEVNDWGRVSSMSGLFENQNLKKFIPNFKDYQILLSFVKYWAKCRNIYGQAFGYLSGVSWSIMVVFFLTKNPRPHLNELDHSARRFESLIRGFFHFYSKMKKSDVISLIDLEHVNRSSSVSLNRSSIFILRSVYPYFITSRNISEQCREVIMGEFLRAVKLFEDEADYEKICEKITEIGGKRVEFTVVNFETDEDLNHIFVLVKAKILALVTHIQKMFHSYIVRVYTEVFKVDNKQAKFFIGLDDKIHSVNNYERELINEHCAHFVRSIKSMAHTSLFHITHDFLF